MDTRLAFQAQAGDEAAFAQLSGLVAARHHRIAFSILRCDDVAQPLLWRPWANVGAFLAARLGPV